MEREKATSVLLKGGGFLLGGFFGGGGFVGGKRDLGLHKVDTYSQGKRKHSPDKITFCC